MVFASISKRNSKVKEKFVKTIRNWHLTKSQQTLKTRFYTPKPTQLSKLSITNTFTKLVYLHRGGLLGLPVNWQPTLCPDFWLKSSWKSVGFYSKKYFFFYNIVRNHISNFSVREKWRFKSRFLWKIEGSNPTENFAKIPSILCQFSWKMKGLKSH